MNEKSYQKSRKALADNLNELIGGKGLSVNGEAHRRKIPQRSLENLTNLDVDPRLSTIAGVAHAFGLEPWQALLPHAEIETRKRCMDWLRLWNSATAPTRRVMEMALRLALEEEQADQKQYADAEEVAHGERRREDRRTS